MALSLNLHNIACPPTTQLEPYNNCKVYQHCMSCVAKRVYMNLLGPSILQGTKTIKNFKSCRAWKNNAISNTCMFMQQCRNQPRLFFTRWPACQSVHVFFVHLRSGSRSFSSGLWECPRLHRALFNYQGAMRPPSPSGSHTCINGGAVMLECVAARQSTYDFKYCNPSGKASSPPPIHIEIWEFGATSKLHASWLSVTSSDTHYTLACTTCTSKTNLHGAPTLDKPEPKTLPSPLQAQHHLRPSLGKFTLLQQPFQPRKLPSQWQITLTDLGLIVLASPFTTATQLSLPYTGLRYAPSKKRGILRLQRSWKFT